MGNITATNYNDFKSAEFIYSKIKREFKSFGSANLIDDADFPLYTAEVLKQLGVSVYKEEEALCKIKNGICKLPDNFMQLYAAYKCGNCKTEYYDKHLQTTSVIENDITCEVLGRNTNCEIHCDCPDKILQRVTIKQYVNDGCINRTYPQVSLLKLSPNVKSNCADDCLNLMASGKDEITINNREILVNFKDGDVYLKYYALALNEEGLPLIPNLIYVEKAIEWYIKYQLLLNFWLVDDLANAQAKWGKAEQLYKEALAEARYERKLPSFITLVNQIRNNRDINKLQVLRQIDRY